MVWGGAKWQLIGGFTVATCLGAAALSHAQFTPFSDHKRALLEGNWQSCRETDGQYGERVYDGRWPGLGPFELHVPWQRHFLENRLDCYRHLGDPRTVKAERDLQEFIDDQVQ